MWPSQSTLPMFARKILVSRLDRRQTTLHADGAVATSCSIFARADFFVRHMNLKNSGRLASRSGQFSGKSGRDRPCLSSVLSRTRQNLSVADRSIHIKRSARLNRLSQVAEWPPSNIQRSRASTSRQRRVFSSQVRSTHPGSQ